MGLLYKIYQSIQERDENTTELMDSLGLKNEDILSRHPESTDIFSKSLAEMLPDSKTD